jgi:hypothetical protein
MLILSLADVSQVFPVQTNEGTVEAFRYRDSLYRSLQVYKTFSETLRACRAVLDENIMCLMTQEQGQGRLWVPLAEDSILQAEAPKKPTQMMYRGAKVAASQPQAESPLPKEEPAPTYMMYRGAKIAMAKPQAPQEPNSSSVGQMMYRGNKLFNQ